MPSTGVNENWLPVDVLRPLSGVPEYELSDAPQSFFLLVELAGRHDLLAGLALGDRRGPLNPNDAPIGDLRTCFAEPDDFGAFASSATHGTDSEHQRLRTLWSKPHYAVKIEKRADGASFLRKITVGRTRNHDIVLRDQSVSKFHASFELLPDNQVLLRDQGSKNLTLINGTPINRATRIYPGDAISFGKVNATLCTNRGLWRSLRAA